jgi:DNA-binding NtrC family response regulator
MKCLIVEDDKYQRLSLKGLLQAHSVVEAKTFHEAVSLLSTQAFDIAFIDLELDGDFVELELAKLAKEKGVYAIITTAHAENSLIQKAYQLGCQDYLTKPITENSLELVLKRYVSFDSEKRIDTLIKKNYITTHPRTLNELNIIKKIGLTDKPILVKGPSGTGKRVVAHIIREALKTSKDKFVEINCAQFTEGLIESELFGHCKGAFTGATEDKIGLLSRGDGGIVFLDEIHSLSKAAQQKLMKAVEEKEFYPVGASKPIKSKFRVICATCEDLLELVTENKFRPDFYARISSIQIELFGLNERKNDILPLINFYCDKNPRKISITEEAKKELFSLEWRKNTRDIESLVEYWQIHGYEVITSKEIPSQFKHQTFEGSVATLSKRDIKKIQEIGLINYLDLLKSQIVETFVEMNNGSQTEAALMLRTSKQFVGKIVKKKSVKRNNQWANKKLEEICFTH